MVRIIKEDLDIEEALKKKLEFICSFCNTECEIKKGSIRTIERTNLSYIEPHKIIIKGITFLAFNYEDNVLDDDDIEELDLSKEKDDFER